MQHRPRTLVDKVWETHLVVVPRTASTPAVLYVDLHLVHEVTSPQAFDGLRERGLPGAAARAHRRHDGPRHPDRRADGRACRHRRSRGRRAGRARSSATAASSASRSTRWATSARASCT